MGSRPRHTPMLMKACTPTHMATPCATSPANVRSIAMACRPMSKPR
ncbi:Uncharacterised protein [Bordetella pertussis]|nr:Uncharacterised protein [Bordetella pertussis]